MWPIITFSASFIGLITLFTLKRVEEHGKFTTPLSPLRRHGDLFIESGMARFAGILSDLASKTHGVIIRGFRKAFHEVEAFTISRVHVLASRIHRYLMRRQRALKNNSEKVSPHLKVMVESKEEGRAKLSESVSEPTE